MIFQRIAGKSSTKTLLNQPIYTILYWLQISLCNWKCSKWGFPVLESCTVNIECRRPKHAFFMGETRQHVHDPPLAILARVVYMCSSLLQLAPGSSNLSQALKRMPERIYNSLSAIGVSPILTFQLDNTER